MANLQQAPTAGPSPADNFTDKPQAQNITKPPPQPQTNCQFPTAFNLYSNRSFNRSYFLAEHQNIPMYTITFHSGWSGNPNVVIHSGPSDKSPVLATWDIRWFGQTATVELPPAAPGGGFIEKVESHGSSRTFQVEIPGPGGMHREAFEWRGSRGDAVSSLRGSHRGRKLVRLSTAHGSGGGPTASGGGEVVAACTSSNWTGNKLFKFEFLGSGAAGRLGERWAVMAIVTAVGMWDRDRNAAGSGATGGGGGC